MYKLGLVGKDISHSRSKSIYEEILKKEVKYSLLDYKSENEIPRLDELFSGGLTGLSITAPYKSHFINQVNIENKLIRNLEIINCIKKVDNRYFATNTDYLAIEEIVTKYLEEMSSVVILGDGKMAQVCSIILNKKAVPYRQYSRSVDGPIGALSLKNENHKTLIINTCSRDFIFKGELDASSLFWDLNYSHAAHKKTLCNICRYEDGLLLLKMQGEFAVKYWGIS